MQCLTILLALVSLAQVSSRWCTHDEFTDEETGRIRLDLMPEHCAWVGLGGMDLTAENLRDFSSALAAHPNLVHLGLGGNNIGDDGAMELARGIKADKDLEWLSLHSNNIGDFGAKALAKALANHPALKMLSLWGNDIGDIGLTALAECIKTNPGIQELSVAMNPRITDEGVRALATAFDAIGEGGHLRTLWLHGLPRVSGHAREELGRSLRGDSDYMALMDDYAPDDGHPLCRRWAALDGECAKNQEYMGKVCASTCGAAPARFARRLTDAHPECPAWAVQDHGCEPIAETCAKSCARVAEGINTHPHDSGHQTEEL